MHKASRVLLVHRGHLVEVELDLRVLKVAKKILEH